MSTPKPGITSELRLALEQVCRSRRLHPSSITVTGKDKKGSLVKYHGAFDDHGKFGVTLL